MQTVSTLDSARAALHAGVTQLESVPYAACHAGVNYYRALLNQLQQEFPATTIHFTLCCGDNPAIAHDALRLGFKAIRLRASKGMQAQLQEIAARYGAQLVMPAGA